MELTLLKTHELIGNGYIYVPDDLVNSYKEHYYWAYISDKIKPLSEYVEE